MVRQIRRKVRVVQGRLLWIAFCRHFLIVLGVASAALALYVLISRLVPLKVQPLQLLPFAAGTAAGWVLLWTWLRRVRLHQAAVATDEALGLKERLSTALIINTPRNQAEEAVIEDAARHAAAVRAARAFPMRLGRPLRRSMFAVATLVLLWAFMPQFDLWALAARKQDGLTPVAVEARKEAVRELEDLAKELAQAAPLEKSEAAKKLDKDLSALAMQIREKKLTGEQAAAKMEKLGEKIGQRRDEIDKLLEKAASMQARGEGRHTSEIAKAMQKGDFAKAAKALDELKKELQNGQLSPEQKEKLAKELAQMAGQLGKESPLGQALAKAADKMQQGELNSALAELEQAGMDMKAMEGLLAEMKELEGLEHDMEARQAALTGRLGTMGEGEDGMGLEGLGEGGMGRRPWEAGDQRNRGNGMGGPGIGQGAVAEERETPTNFEKKRVKGDIAPGEVIARMKVSGRQPPGEIKTEFEELRIQSEQAAEDTIKSEQLPLEHKALVRKYFDAIKEAPAEPAAPAPAPATTPAARP